MTSKSILLVATLAALAVCHAAPAAEEAKPQESSMLEDGVEKVYRFIQDCGDKDMFLCMKMRALTLVDRVVSRVLS